MVGLAVKHGILGIVTQRPGHGYELKTEFDRLTGAAVTGLTIVWGSIGAAVVVSLALAPLVGLLPARWASRLDVLDALRYE